MVVLIIAGGVVLSAGLVVFILGSSEHGKIKLWNIHFDIPATILVMMLGVILLLAGFFGPSIMANRTNDAEAGEVPQGDTQTSAQADKQEFGFDEPAQFATVSAAFPVSGTAATLGDDTLWMFVISDTAEGPEPVFYKTTDSPIPIADGRWATRQGPLGAPGDEGYQFTLVAVRAAERCSQAITRPAPNKDGDVIFKTLPDGCSELGRLTVTKG